MIGLVELYAHFASDTPAMVAAPNLLGSDTPNTAAMTPP